MSKNSYSIFAIATGLLKGTILVSVVLWFLPIWGINIPIWGLISIVGVFLTYEIITFILGKRALEKKLEIGSEAMVGIFGKAITPLVPYGYVQVKGELWRAFSNDTSVKAGDDIVVLELNRLTLRVTLANCAPR